MTAQASLGRAGLPLTVPEMLARHWDVIIVGGGHNGLAAAAYLAREALSVLVVERRDRLGGACTLEAPFADARYKVSPCAYVVGLLHPLVIEELDLPRHGYPVQPVDPHLWCPFEDGTSLTLWNDTRRSADAVAALSPGDVDGYLAYEARSAASARLFALPRATRGSVSRRPAPRWRSSSARTRS